MGYEINLSKIPKEEIEKLREYNKNNIKIVDFDRKQDSIKYEILFNLKSLEFPKCEFNNFKWNSIEVFYNFLYFKVYYLCELIEQEFDLDIVKWSDEDELYFCGRQYSNNSEYVSLTDMTKIIVRGILDSLLFSNESLLEDIQDILNNVESEVRENRAFYYINKFKDYVEESY